MKNLILCIVFVLCVINTQAQEKTYILTEIDVAPKLLNYPLVDSLDTKQNFKRNVNKFINRNIEIYHNNTKKTKVYIQFLIKNNGEVIVLQVKSNSPFAKLLAVKVISKLKNIEAAVKGGVKVDMKYTVPITFNPSIIIDKTK